MIPVKPTDERVYEWSRRTGSMDGLLDLEPAGEDAWLGRSPEYPWGWVYGGRIAAQALRAGALTCADTLIPSSLQCVFLRPARCDLAREHRVSRLTDTRRRAARAVAVSQEGALTAQAIATFDEAAAGKDDELVRAGVAPDAAMAAALDGRFLGDAVHVGCFERRRLDAGPGRLAALITLDRAPRSPAETACLVTYIADDLPSDAARGVFADESYLEGPGTALWSMTASYSLHFGTAKAGRTLVFDARVASVDGSRASVEGVVADAESGRVVALCLQQVMLRRRRDAAR